MTEYIEREAAIAYIREQSEECQKAFEELGGESGIYADAYNDLAEDFYSISAADVAPVVHGRWIEKSAPARKIYFECSHCGAQENKHTAIKGYYCWRCGAKMDGEESANADDHD